MANNMITVNYMEAVGKQIFSRDFIINGLMPCQSSFTKLMIQAKMDWKYNNAFEYRMLLSHTNSGGTVNTQTFESNYKLQHLGKNRIAIFKATYGTIMDGFTIDMTKQLETKESRAAFNNEYTLLLHSMRMNVAAMFKNIMIHGRYMPMHRVAAPLITDDGKSTVYPIMIAYPDNENRPTDVFTVVPVKNDNNNGCTVAEDNIVSVPTGKTADVGFPAGTYYDLGPLKRGTKIRIPTPFNVWNSNFKEGKLLNRATTEMKYLYAKDTATIASAVGEDYFYDEESTITGEQGRFAPWGKSYLADMWAVSQHQPNFVEYTYIGMNNDIPAKMKKLYCGTYFVVAGNRKVKKEAWNNFKLTREGTALRGTQGISFDEAYVEQDFAADDISTWRWGTTTRLTDGSYADTWNGVNSGNYYYSEATGAMEGLPDLCPWYTVYGGKRYSGLGGYRMGLDRFFRGQENRIRNTIEMAGMLIPQQLGESIMDTMMVAVNTAQQVCDWEDLIIFMNTTTLTAIGMYESMMGVNGNGMQLFKQVDNDTKLLYQRGVTGLSFKIGTKLIHNIVQDSNFPTDVIMIMPRKDIQFSCWDNVAFEMNNYIQETLKGSKPPKIKDISVPNELLQKMDMSQRIIFGNTEAADLSMVGLGGQNGFVHASDSMPVAYKEAGALFTENIYSYFCVKLLNQINSPSDVLRTYWPTAEGTKAA